MTDWRKRWDEHKENYRMKYLFRYGDEAVEFIMGSKLQKGTSKILENVVNFGYKTVPQKVKHYQLWLNYQDEDYEFIKVSYLDQRMFPRGDWILRPKKGQEMWHLDIQKRKELSEMMNGFPFENFCNEKSS